MKTTEFFKQIKKEANNSTLENTFSYRINPDNRFYQIVLHDEPTDKIKVMCERNGFSISQNILLSVDDNGKKTESTIWEVMPVDINDMEYASDEILKNVNSNVIIASDQAMIEAGLIKCNPRQNTITVWVYEMNLAYNKMQWTPIMFVYTTPLTEDMKDEEGNVIDEKSTHKIDEFYGSPISGRLDLRQYLIRKGVTVEEL